MTSYSKYKVLDNKLDTVIKSHEKILQLLVELKEEVLSNRCRCSSSDKRAETSKPTLTAAPATTPIANKDKKSVSFAKVADSTKNLSAKSVGSKPAPILKNGKAAIKSSETIGSTPSGKANEGSSKTAKPTVVRSGNPHTEVKSPTDESLNSEKMETAAIEVPINSSEGNTSTEFAPAEFDVVWGEASPTPPPVTSRKPNPKKLKSVRTKLSASLNSSTKSNNSNQPGSGTKEVPKVKNTLKLRGSSNKRKRDEVRRFNSFKKRRDTRLVGSEGIQRETAKGSIFL